MALAFFCCMVFSILGKITKVDDQWLRVEVAKGIVLTVARSTVSQTVPKGSYKAD